jgi:hypothetical protein
MALTDYGLTGLFSKKGREKQRSLFFGNPEEHERVSTLLPGQQPLFVQSVQAGLQPGAGGAFGTAADYYRSLLEEDNPTFGALAAPEERRFREQIIPDLAYQFGGMYGGIGSSAFQNASINAGTDLAERLASIRAGLRQQGAAGLMGIGQQGLGNYSQDMTTKQATPGLIGSLASLAGPVAGALGGPVASAVGSMAGKAGDWLSNMFKRNSSPYGEGTGRNMIAGNSNLPSLQTSNTGMR